MIRYLVSMLFVSVALSAQEKSGPAQQPDPWQALRFLIGTWEAKTVGGSAGAAASGTYTFQLELGNHVLARHSSSAGCKGPADFDCEHGDLLYIYEDAPGQPLKAIYFDNEGHVIHYEAATPGPNTVVLTSAPPSSGLQYRLRYQRKGQVMQGELQIRPPGQSDFRSYLEWTGGPK